MYLVNKKFLQRVARENGGMTKRYVKRLSHRRKRILTSKCNLVINVNRENCNRNIHTTFRKLYESHVKYNTNVNVNFEIELEHIVHVSLPCCYV